MPYTIEVQGIVASIYDSNGNVVLVQSFNPETGMPFSDSNEAYEWAQQYVTLFLNDTTVTMQDEDEFRPLLKVSFIDPETKRPIKLWLPNKAFQVKVEMLDPTSMQPIPLTGVYIVPYFNYVDGYNEGACIVEIKNGIGISDITIPYTGIYTIKLDKVLNAKTMQQPSPLPILADNPILTIVDKLPSDPEAIYVDTQSSDSNATTDSNTTTLESTTETTADSNTSPTSDSNTTTDSNTVTIVDSNSSSVTDSNTTTTVDSNA